MSARSLRISRRGILTAGAALTAASLLPRGVGANNTPPKRVLFVFSANGTIYDNWAPTGTETQFTLSPILAPLAPYQKKLVIVDGLDVKAAHQGPGDDHMKGMGCMLTSIELLPGNTQGGAGTPAGFAGGISIDQRIAQDVGQTTRFPSLEFGVFVQSSDVWARMIYSGANQPLPPMEDPVKAYARLFSGSTGTPAQIAALLKRRQSVLDHVQDTLGSLGGKVSGDDKTRVLQHQDSVRQIEKQIIAQTAACSAPTGVTMMNLTDEANYPAVGKLQMDLLVAALACDQTRVASLQWSHSVSQIGFPWLGISQGHHDLSHKDDTDTVSKGYLVQINTWYAQQFAYLLGKLDAIPESDGTTLLDNTLVVWVNELAKGNIHSHAPLPIVMAGSCGGAIKTGRYLKVANGTPQCNLLVSIANAMGVSMSTFGNPAYCTGPLSVLA
jgi:hypothetical protein